MLQLYSNICFQCFSTKTWSTKFKKLKLRKGFLPSLFNLNFQIWIWIWLVFCLDAETIRTVLVCEAIFVMSTIYAFKIQKILKGFVYFEWNAITPQQELFVQINNFAKNEYFVVLIQLFSFCKLGHFQF